MRVLLDTNEIIGREDHAAPGAEHAALLRLLSERGVTTLVHPATREELLRDRNPERRAVVLAKLATYAALEAPPDPTEAFRTLTRERESPNDRVDTKLLFALRADVVDFLVTEDQELLDRAALAGLGDRALNVRAALVYFSEFFAIRVPGLPQYVESGPIVGTWITDPFFDSFKEDYGAAEFTEWFTRSARGGRPGVWVKTTAGSLGAVMIYKDETEPLGAAPRKRRLKICSFKVAPEMQGLRLSERMLWFAFLFMAQNRIDEAYVDVLPRHADLLSFFQSFGFIDFARTPKGEDRLLKSLNPAAVQPIAVPGPAFRQRFPAFDDGPGVAKYIVPIQADWHSRLFPEFQAHRGQRVLDHWSGTPFNFSAAGNAIRKAYICRAKIRRIREGDLLLFYRSRDVRKINEIGVVERAVVCRGVQEVVDIIGNRTVLPSSVLEPLCATPVLVLLFWHAGPFPNPSGTGVSLDVLGSNAAAPQSIAALSEEEYQKLCGKRTAR